MKNTDDLDTSNVGRGRGDLRERLLSLRLEVALRRRQNSRGVITRARQGTPIPLSYAQERLWFLDQLGLVGAAYNVPSVFRLSGNLDEGALEGSIAELVHRHASLRTHFGLQDGTPHQVIDPPGAFRLNRVDLREVVDPQRRESELQEWMRKEQMHHFDLHNGPLLRVVLVRMSATEWVLILTMHHVISDGWSLGILMRELSVLYVAHLHGQSSPLGELPVQYADYAIWQREWLQGTVLHDLLSYWRRQLAGAPTQLQLPTDRPRPAIEGFKGALLEFDLPLTLSKRLEDLGRREGATFFMVLLAAYQVLLSRYSGQRDIVVGSPIAGRQNHEIEGLIGFFVNTLPLRTEVSEDLTFYTLLRRVREVTLDAYAHQDLPFEALVKELRPERNLTRQPIVQVLLALQNFPQERLELAGLTSTDASAEWVTAHFDLALYVKQLPERVSCVFEFATDLFDRVTIERMAGHYVALLERVLAKPERPIREMSPLSEVEKQQLLVQWNDTAAAYPHDRCVHELFLEQVERAHDATALVCDDKSLSYLELNSRANYLAHQLTLLGVGSDVVVGVQVERSIEMIVAFLGILKAGGAYLPVDPTYSPERMALLLQEARVSIVLSKAALAGRLPAAVREVIYLDGDIAKQSTSNPVSHASSTNLAYVLYTSGSSGRPKAVGVTHKNIARLLIGTNYIDVDARDVFLQLAPPNFDASTFEIWGALLNGCALVLYSDREVDLECLQLILERQRVTVLWLTAGLFHQVMDERPRALGIVRLLLAGGDVLSIRHVRQVLDELPRCTLVNGYGPTEATTFSTYFTVTTVGALGSTVPIGRPIANTQIYVLDEYLSPVPVGVVGELYIAGDGLARGYLGRPELTAERFIANPFGVAGGRLYRTGDLVRYLSDGNLEFFRRIDNQVKIRGYRVELGEIESVLREHAAVKEAVVIAREDSPGERRLVAYVVGDGNASEMSNSDESSEKLRTEIVDAWEALYEETYAKQNGTSPSFVGWESSFTGQPIPKVEMEEWLGSTVERIRSLEPNRVLEIGCGVGLILQHLAPHCAAYVGTDFSTSALERLRHWMAGRERLRHVTLLHRTATSFRDLEPGSFDTVILNSVVQYFPDVDYLLKVVRGAARILRAGGKIFVGDVRHLGLLPTFHSAVQLSRAAASLSVGQLRRRIARAVTQDKELVIDPSLFFALRGRLDGISGVEVQLKRGNALNELTRYRYDVVLRIGEQSEGDAIYDHREWALDIRSTAELESALREKRWKAVQLSSIPNVRLIRDVVAQKLIETSDERLEVGALRREISELQFDDVDPEAVWRISEASAYLVTVTPGKEGYFDAVLLDRAGAKQTPSETARPSSSVKPWTSYANDPLESGLRQKLVPKFREYLQARLPEYMLPSAWVVLKELPLTRNGKVDRGGLPIPQSRAEELGEYHPPRNKVEQSLAEIWGQLLRVDRIGTRDNFFQLGGHSLLAIKALYKVNQLFGTALRVTDLYRNPTVGELAVRVHGEAAEDEFIDLPREATLDDKIVARGGRPAVPARSILLTGGTGFVGRFLLAQLLRESDATVYCLARAPSQRDAVSRLCETLRKWNLWERRFEGRIIGVPGDLSRPRLGLDHVSYELVCREADSIYHCATSMNHLETYAMARAANVRSAEELLTVGTHLRPKVINYISTLGVFSSSVATGGRVVDETSSIDKERHSTSNGYVGSKWVSEKIFSVANARGIPCNIFRLGLVWADSKLGRYDELQSVYRIFKSCIICGYGIESYRYEIAPTAVDYVARAIAYLAGRHSTGGGIFHIASPASLIEGVFERCNEISGTSLKLVPFYDWVCEIKRLHLRGQTLPAVPIVEFAFSMDEKSFYEYQRKLVANIVKVDCTRTYDELERADILAPRLDDELLGVFLSGISHRDPELRELMDSRRLDGAMADDRTRVDS